MKRTRTTRYRMSPNEMEEYNLVTARNAVIPAYDLTKNEISITLYFNNEGDLIISGNVENTDYIFWLSFTKIDDVELNERILNHIAKDEMERVSHLYRVLEQQEISYADLEDYYAVQIERNSDFFAGDVQGFADEIHTRCRLRECGGKYEEVLKSYADFLGKQESYIPDVRKLEELLKAEDYLCLSESETIQTLYKECRRSCRELYNRYMNQVR